MALNAKISKTDFDGLSDEIKTHYSEKDGSYILDVTKVEGLALENVDGLKSTVEKLRKSEKDLTSSTKALQASLEAEQAKFAGIDPDQARELLGKVDEIKNWKGEEKVRAAVEAAETKHKQILDQINKQHKDKTDELAEEINDMSKQLQDAIVTTRVTTAIVAEGGNVDLLLPHVKGQVNMVKDAAGKFKPEVVNSEGIARIGDTSGNPMTVEQLVQEMKSKNIFAAAFSGVNSSGTGNRGANESNNETHTTNHKPKVVKSSDDKGMSANLEDIAAGKVTVDMSESE